MSLMDKIKSFFSGGSSAADSHAGHDHSSHDHSLEPTPSMPADPVGMPTSEPADSEPEGDR